MGSDPTRDPEARPDELPQHSVTVSAFEIARYPVTVAEYRHAVQAGVVRKPWLWGIQTMYLRHPVVNVAWQEALDYAAWLMQVTSQQWRLPSEAEWEKAARGTDGRIYPWGDAWDPTLGKVARLGGDLGTVAIGERPGSASPYGVEDMAGNVWEWTTSLHYPYPYDPTDGREDMNVPADIPDYEADARHARVMRGGSWDEDATWSRAAMRGFHVPPWNLDGYIGFRLARD